MLPNILTYSGVYIHFLNLERNVYLVEDIAHALSNICRFNGHTQSFYSVAQHSVLASRYVLPEFSLETLFHDATEAYLGDVSSPLKMLLPEYKTIENNMHISIANAYGLPHKMSAEVKTADCRMLSTEKRDLMVEKDWCKMDWGVLDGVEPYTETIVPWDPSKAKSEFINQYKRICLSFGILENP